jgi:chromosome segregation ATPase
MAKSNQRSSVEPKGGLPFTGPQDIDALRSRYQKLSTAKTRAETNLEHARTQLDHLKRQARDAFGTDDLEQLKAKLKAMNEENEQKRSKYQQDLEKIESDLQKVQEAYDASKAEEPA